MRLFLLLVALVTAPTSLLAQTALSHDALPGAIPTPPARQPGTTPTAGDYDRFEEFLNDSVRSPLFYLQAVGGGLLDQLGHFPEEWEGSAGFAKRNAARVGQAFAAEAIGHAAAAVLHHRVAYDACTCRGLARVGHAISRAFVSVKNDGSGLSPNWSLWSSKYASAGLANAWYPKSYTKRDVLVQATGAIGTSAGLNIVKEFAPELLRLF